MPIWEAVVCGANEVYSHYPHIYINEGRLIDLVKH